jgi:hypothetical protein
LESVAVPLPVHDESSEALYNAYKPMLFSMPGWSSNLCALWRTPMSAN